jgi:hypothetical protein
VRTIVAVVLLLASSLLYGRNFVADIASDSYKRVPIPAAWIPVETASAIRKAGEYPRQHVRNVEIVDFIRVYGLPSYLVVPKTGKGSGFLVYDLDDNYKILVEMNGNLDGRFLYAQLFRADGQPEGPVQK